MTDQMVIEIVKMALYYTIIVVGPLLLVSLLIGLIISVFQAATSISEQTLTFVPKLFAIFLVILLLLPYLIGNMKDLTIEMMKRISGM